MSFQKKLYLFSGLFLISSSALAYHVPNGFYINGSAGIGLITVDKMKAKDVKNESIPTFPTQITIPVQINPFQDNDKSSTELGYKIAVGYADKDLPFRLEISYLKINDLQYKADTLLETNPAPNPKYTDFKSKFDNFSVLFNGYLDLLNNYSRIMPYFTAGIGYASNKIEFSSTVFTSFEAANNGPAPEVVLDNINGKQKTNSFAWQVGIGSRFRITNNLLVDINIQHIDFGNVKWETKVQETFGDGDLFKFKQKFSAKMYSNQVSLSLSLFFGDQSEPLPSLIDKI